MVSGALVLAALLVMVIGFNVRDTDEEPAPLQVLLMVEDDTGVFVLQLRLGAQKALGELGGDLSSEVVDLDGLRSAGDDWPGRGFSGALVYIEDDLLRQTALQMLDDRGIPVVVIGSWDGSHTAVCQDETQLGVLAANLAGDCKSVWMAGGSTQARLAASDALGDRLVTEDAFDVMDAANCIIALDQQAALELCERKRSGGWQCAMVAVDPGETRAEQLEQGIVQTMLLASPYATGYRAAADALWQRPDRLYGMPYFSVDEAHMYDAENVKLVFPLLD